MSFAKATLSGTVTSDPEKRFTPNNHAVTSFTLSAESVSNRPGAANEPLQVKITCWRGLADAVETQLQKGDNVLVEGKLLMNSFQTQEGVQKKLFEIEAVSIDKLPGRPEPLLVASEAQQSSGGGSSSSNGGASSGVDAASRSSAPNYNAGYGPNEPASAGHFSSEDLLTEDDIPF